MFVLILFAVVLTDVSTQPVYPITRPSVEYYVSRESCEADMKKQGLSFMDDLQQRKLNVGMYAAKCIEVNGAAGAPA